MRVSPLDTLSPEAPSCVSPLDTLYTTVQAPRGRVCVQGLLDLLRLPRCSAKQIKRMIGVADPSTGLLGLLLALSASLREFCGRFRLLRRQGRSSRQLRARRRFGALGLTCRRQRAVLLGLLAR